MDSVSIRRLLSDLQSAHSLNEGSHTDTLDKIINGYGNMRTLQASLLTCIKDEGYIKFPLYIDNNDNDDKNVKQSLRQLLLFIKKAQARSNDSKFQVEETLGVAINTYVNDNESKRAADKISNMVCHLIIIFIIIIKMIIMKKVCKYDENKSKTLYEYLKSYKAGMHTKEALNKKVMRLYEGEVYEELRDFLALDNNNNNIDDDILTQGIILIIILKLILILILMLRWIYIRPDDDIQRNRLLH